MTRSALFSFGLFLGLALCIGLTPAAPAWATLVTTTVSGTTTTADASNPFGLSVGNAVSAVAVYDDSGIPAAGNFSLKFNSGSGFSLTITLGSFVFHEFDDDLFGGEFPQFLFTDGDLVGINFGIDGFSIAPFDDLTVGSFNVSTQWFLDDNIGTPTTLLEGTWDFANAVTEPNQVTDVPEPASWLLFTAGLVGLLAIPWRRPRCARPAA